MSNKEKIAQEVEALFANKAKANINTFYATSDGHIFSAEHYANNWVASNPKLTIEVFRRPDPAVADTETSADHGETVGESSEGTEDAVRADLVKQYIELFDTKPAHNIGLDKLQDKITAKRLELEKENKSTEVKHVVNEEDLKNNPELTEQDVKAGDEIEIPAE